MRKINVPPSISKAYNIYRDFMEDQVEFSLGNQGMHTLEHCQRVLLFALLIAEKMHLDEHEKEILCLCASFHDSRRKDDGLDVGHGRRAAEYYKYFCTSREIKFESWAYCIMAYHDLDDHFGEHAMVIEITGRQVLLYQIFKDADALDRFRLGPNALDITYLRTEAAKDLYEYAESLWNKQ